MASTVNDPAMVRREYATEDRFLARRLSSWADLDGPLVEDIALGALMERAPSRVLEVGCGTGDYSQRVRDTVNAEFVAVDLSERMATLTRARRISAAVADIERLPFLRAQFDAVLANRVLYHLADL